VAFKFLNVLVLNTDFPKTVGPSVLTGTSVLFTSHPQDGLVVNFYIPHNRRTPLQAEEALGPISYKQKKQ
jgi:hypothetical protein